MIRQYAESRMTFGCLLLITPPIITNLPTVCKGDFVGFGGRAQCVTVGAGFPSRLRSATTSSVTALPCHLPLEGKANPMQGRCVTVGDGFPVPTQKHPTQIG